MNDECYCGEGCDPCELCEYPQCECECDGDEKNTDSDQEEETGEERDW